MERFFYMLRPSLAACGNWRPSTERWALIRWSHHWNPDGSYEAIWLTSGDKTVIIAGSFADCLGHIFQLHSEDSWFSLAVALQDGDEASFNRCAITRGMTTGLKPLPRRFAYSLLDDGGSDASLAKRLAEEVDLPVETFDMSEPKPTTEQIKKWASDWKPPCILCHKKGGFYHIEPDDSPGQIKVTITTHRSHRITVTLADLPVGMFLCRDCEEAIDDGRARNLSGSKHGVIETVPNEGMMLK